MCVGRYVAMKTKGQYAYNMYILYMIHTSAPSLLVRQGFMQFSWIYPDYSSHYSSITLILGSVRKQGPFLLNPMPQLPAPSIVPFVSGKLWDPDIERRRKVTSWKILLMAGKGGGWGGKSFESPSGVYICFFFFVCLFVLVLVLFFWFSNMMGDKGRRDEKAMEGCGVTEA